MTEDKIRHALLVQAIEEKAGEVVTPPVVKEARQVAGDPANNTEEWIYRRSVALLERIDPHYSMVLQLDPAPTTLLTGLVATAAVIGLAANYLGDHGRVHVLFNPVLALVIWNLAVYALVVVLAIFRRPRRPLGHRSCWPLEKDEGRSVSRVHEAWTGNLRAPNFRSSILKALLLRGFRWTQEAMSRIHAVTAPVKSFGAVAARFLWLWQQASEPLLMARLKRTIHAAALCLAVGAVAGMYIRGVGFQYNAFWSSTFIRDAGRVNAILSVVFSPVSLVWGRRFPSATEVDAILTPDGAIAAPWIHAYAILALLLIAIPRVGLIVVSSLQIRSLRRNLHLDLTDPQWVRTLRGDAEMDVGAAASGVLREFALDRHATTVLMSLQNALVERDIADRSRPSSGRDSKARWLEQWRSILSKARATLSAGDAPEFLPLESPAFRESVDKLKTTAPPMATDLILLEIAAFARFVAFRPLTGGTRILRKPTVLDRSGTKRFLSDASAIIAGDGSRGPALDAALDGTIKSLTHYWWKVGGLTTVGLGLGALTGGLAAPAIGALLGEAMGLTGAAALTAGLAALGGGAVAAGGLGMAGGTALIVGGGAILGAGLGPQASRFLQVSPDAFFLEAAKIEVVLRKVARDRLQNPELEDRIRKGLNDAILGLQTRARELRLLPATSEKQLKNIESCVRILETVRKRNRAQSA